MPVSSSDLTVGPCDIYVAPFTDALAVEPATPTTAAAANWIYAGATDGGLKLVFGMKYVQQYVDQSGFPLASSLDQAATAAAIPLTKVNSTNFKTLMNGGTITTTGTGATAMDAFEPVADLVANDPVYFKILIRGKAPVSDTGFAGQKRDINLRKVLQVSDLTYTADKTNKSMFAGVSAMCHFVSNSIAPWGMKTMNATA
ncbi:MAG: hypothetical protein JWQ81_1675 [Amycolatopsis sp.]|jgi:hypothetical protein|uniref:hypothetical protein n=1 Tax=Amycolatopsis sp. TaxID=37632 RepID=UPI0026263505|nr:hypothetical protein [Amycolatopsis sp.]MCU1680936.1 hypothetical protein [Amycolatopsis sp.]